MKKHNYSRDSFVEILNKLPHEKDEFIIKLRFRQESYPDKFGFALRKYDNQEFEERYLRWIKAQ